MPLFSSLFQVCIQWALPTECILCRKIQPQSCCSSCLQNLLLQFNQAKQRCESCGLACDSLRSICNACFIRAPAFDRTYFLAYYQSPLKEALHRLKYQARLANAHGIASIWNALMQKIIEGQQADWAIPVPLSKNKLAARGFNQSWEILRRIYLAKSVEKNPFLLKRHHHSMAQALANRKERQVRLKKQFYIEASFRPHLKNKSVIVFDDVMTTGSTLNEIALVLKENGVKKVINWVVLRTPTPY
ncbi:MAG: ComF family protein [Polynucleobacter sp.]|nr:ComF family protein [Polynucleobacter sp.]